MIGYTWSGWFACFPAYTFLNIMVVYGKYTTIGQGPLHLLVFFLVPVTIIVYFAIVFFFFLKN
jgi:hypothetical protein